MKYEALLSEADKQGIIVKEKKLKLREGLCCDNRIAINKNIETTSKKTCVLAEELGHYHTTVGNILDLKDLRDIKQEKKARNWAYEKLVGLVSIINAYEKGIKDKFDLAEYLDVTENFLDEAIEHYRQKYGVCYTIDHYAIYFEPNLGIMKMF